MLIASENEQYELATEFRNVIQYLSNKFENQSITFNIDKDFDVIVFKEHDDLLFVVIHYFKNGSFFMQEDYVLEIKIDLYQTVVDFLNYFYSNRNQPDFMITNIEIEANDLIFKNKIILPKQGKYSRAIDNALKNASEEDRKIIEIVKRLDEEYGLGESFKNALKIKNWCKVNYGDKEIWDRKLPSSTAEDEEEKRLGKVLNNIKMKIKKYEGKELEEIEDEEDE